MNDSCGTKNARLKAGPGPADHPGLSEAAAEIQQIRLSARRELELACKIRAEACRYQQETASRARSEAQALILKARLETRREIAALVRQASSEIQKVLADIRVIRITAEEELDTQRKFTDAARLCSLSPASRENGAVPAVKKKKPAASG